MIGSSLALALAPLSLRVALVEAVAREDARQPSFDDRSTALSRSSKRMFEAIGLWQDVAAASTPIRSIHVSDRGRFGFAHIDAEEQRVEALGYVVINRVLGEVLQNALPHVDGLQVLCPARITAAAAAGEGVTVRCESDGGERQLHCSLLVAADGMNSTARQLLGIGATRVDYGQCAVIGNVLPEVAPAGRAFERFTVSGSLALLPIADERAAFVWVLPPERAEELLAMSDTDFCAALQSTFGNRLGRFTRASRRGSWPLTLSRAKRLTAKRSALVGNAANGLHPVAAQGFNLGMRDVAALCDCIADVLVADGAIGSDAMLSAYADWRRADQRKVVGFTDGLVRLFGSERPAVRALRDVGMLGFDLVPGVRTLFARHTMGLAGRLPRLSRGVPLG